MSIFRKKYDYEKNYLSKRYDPTICEYVFYLLQDGVFKKLEEEDLNRRSQLYLREENERLLSNPELQKHEEYQLRVLKRVEKFRQLGLTSSFESTSIQSGSMSSEMGEYLENLTNEDDCLIGIHRIGIDDSPSKIADILWNGLVIHGHLSGMTSQKVSLGDTISYYHDNKTVIKEIMGASAYKNSKGCILVRVPFVDLEKNESVCFVHNGEVRLNPIYIEGYIPVDEKHHIETMIKGVRYQSDFESSESLGAKTK